MPKILNFVKKIHYYSELFTSLLRFEGVDTGGALGVLRQGATIVGAALLTCCCAVCCCGAVVKLTEARGRQRTGSGDVELYVPPARQNSVGLEKPEEPVVVCTVAPEVHLLGDFEKAVKNTEVNSGRYPVDMFMKFMRKDMSPCDIGPTGVEDDTDCGWADFKTRELNAMESAHAKVYLKAIEAMETLPAGEALVVNKGGPDIDGVYEMLRDVEESSYGRVFRCIFPYRPNMWLRILPDQPQRRGAGGVPLARADLQDSMLGCCSVELPPSSGDGPAPLKVLPYDGDEF